MNKIIRHLREDSDLKQSDIALILDITQQSYSNYESGHSELPIRHLNRLCKYYKVNADYILGNITFKNDLSKLNQLIGKSSTLGDIFSKILNLSKNQQENIINYIDFLIHQNTKKNK